jgi:hypothetical protein
MFNRISHRTLNNLKQEHFTWSFCDVLLQPSLSICSVFHSFSSRRLLPFKWLLHYTTLHYTTLHYTTLYCCSHFGPHLGRFRLLGCFPLDFFSKTILLFKYIHTTLSLLFNSMSLSRLSLNSTFFPFFFYLFWSHLIYWTQQLLLLLYSRNITDGV